MREIGRITLLWNNRGRAQKTLVALDRVEKATFPPSPRSARAVPVPTYPAACSAQVQ